MLKDADSYFPSWLLKREDFQKFLSDDESCPEEFLSSALKPVDLRTANDLYFIVNWFKKCRITKHLKEFSLVKIAKGLEILNVKKGKVFGCQEIGTLTMVVKGRIGIYKEKKKIGIVAPRMAVQSSICFKRDDVGKAFKALTDAILVKTTGDDVKTLLFSQDSKSYSESLKLLKSLKFFSLIPSSKLQIFCENLSKQYFSENELIYQESEDSSYFFLIKSGEVHLEKRLTLTNKHNLPIRKILITKKHYNFTVSSLGPGDVFGLEESINNKSYAFSASSYLKSTIFAFPKYLLFEVLNEKELSGVKLQFESCNSSKDFKKRMKISISSSLQRMKTVIEITECPDSSDRGIVKKRTWDVGADCSTQIPK
jgi:CRP-like cAMP-binding protein